MQKKLFIVFYLLIGLAACTNEQPTSSATTNITLKTKKKVAAPHFIDDLFNKYNIDKNTSQIVLSYNISPSDITGKLIGFEKVDDQWQMTLDTIPVNFGKNGFAPFDEKQEGDGKSPTGIFDLGKAFGYADDIPHDIEYLTLNENHYWDSDSKSETYNQLLTERPTTKHMEVMRRKDHLYKYGIIIEYNTENPIPNNGSAIFLHIQRRTSAPTAGCISMEEEKMKSLINWLKADKQPMIAMGTKEEL